MLDLDRSLEIEDVHLERLELAVSPEWTRATTVVHLRGAGAEGVGEDVTYQPELHDRLRTPEVLGRWTLDSFSAQLEGFDFFDDAPEDPAARDYRRWAWESAALDLALNQAGVSLAEMVGRAARPVT